MKKRLEADLISIAHRILQLKNKSDINQLYLETQKLYEKFGDDFTESKIYRVRFTDLLEWILTLPHFEGKKEESNEGHLEMIQSAWVYEWRDNQKK